MSTPLPEERIKQIAERVVTVRVGDSCLTRDLVWCQCGRGLSLTGKWFFCPKCGGRIDQESYLHSVDEALKNGARLYRDADDALVHRKALAWDFWVAAEEAGGHYDVGCVLPNGNYIVYRKTLKPLPPLEKSWATRAAQYGTALEAIEAAMQAEASREE